MRSPTPEAGLGKRPERVAGLAAADLTEAVPAAGTVLLIPPGCAEGHWDWAEYGSAGNLLAADSLAGAELPSPEAHARAAACLAAVGARCYDPRPGRWLSAGGPLP